MNQLIGFFHEYDEYGCFSNWYPAEFDYAGVHYVNTEQYMMYQKTMMFREYELAKRVLETSDPAECKAIGRQQFQCFDSEMWNRTCKRIMKRGIKAKFAQNRNILSILLSTGHSLLAECSPYDKKWGIGIGLGDSRCFQVAEWNGENLLGRILMEVREELRREMILSPDHLLIYKDAHDMEPIREWNMTAGEIKRIPQFYEAIHAYSETLKPLKVRDIFCHDYSLNDWEIAMRTNMGGGLPFAGFYEMKQDVYETVWSLNALDIR